MPLDKATKPNIFFQTNILRKGMNPCIPDSSYGLNNTIPVLLQGWIGHWITHKGWYAIKQWNQNHAIDYQKDLFKNSWIISGIYAIAGLGNTIQLFSIPLATTLWVTKFSELFLTNFLVGEGESPISKIDIRCCLSQVFTQWYTPNLKVSQIYSLHKITNVRSLIW